MINRLFTTAVLLSLLAGCNSQTLPTEQSSAPELPDVECYGKLPEALKASTGNYHLAEESDFVPAIRSYAQPSQPNTCSIFTVDLNGDNQKDYAVLLVNAESPTSRFQLLINQGNGEFTSVVTRDYQRLSNPEEGTVYTSMNLKPAGEPGQGLRDYFPLKPGTPQREVFESQPAIEL